mgnify:CR=1 FL=1
MTEKPKIQYIGQFYVPGSEAQVLAPKKKKKKAKTKLPIAKQEQVKAIYIDPVALIGITVAVVMLAVMVVGALQLRSDWAQYEQMSNYVSRLNQNNAELERTYRDGYDLEDIRDKALALGYEKMATGHYARVEWDAGSGRWLLRRAADAAKDQSYVLYSLTQAQLSRVLLPMGGMTKDAAREKAEALGLTVAHKHDSQDICFVPDGDYMRFLTEHGVRPQPGHFIGLDGRDFGPHRGQEAYTLGQRRGLDIPYGTRIYVVAKRGSDVVIGPNEALFSRRVQVRDLNWIPFDVPPEGLRAQAKLRYTPKTAECTVHLTENGAELCFDEPQRAVTPGQAAVLYDGDTVLGGGTICGAD